LTLLPRGPRFDNLAIFKLRHYPEAAARRDAQIAFVRANYTWSGRAKEWDGWLSELAER